MTIITNNVLIGAMAGARGGVGSGFVPGGVTNISKGDPSDVVIAQTGSDILWDSANATYYMALGGVGGSTWVTLGSIE